MEFFFKFLITCAAIIFFQLPFPFKQSATKLAASTAQIASSLNNEPQAFFNNSHPPQKLISIRLRVISLLIYRGCAQMIPNPFRVQHTERLIEKPFAMFSTLLKGFLIVYN